jgi:hypothetical protein
MATAIRARRSPKLPHGRIFAFTSTTSTFVKRSWLIRSIHRPNPWLSGHREAVKERSQRRRRSRKSIDAYHH